MHYAASSLEPAHIYKLLTGIVVPRPIAWVTSRNRDGLLNLAPFSFFNCVGTDPGLVILSVGNHPDRPKDTATNIQMHPFFVVNMVDEKHAQAMSDSATDYPGSISEIDDLKLETIASPLIDLPRLADVPAAFECKLHSVQTIGNNRLILGEILGIYVRDEFIVDAQRHHIASAKMNLIGRMGGLGGYTRTTNVFEIERKRFKRDS
jgi:flavin reductase (DIM6/NTAB) family NADH-FMN oxidoreductase RutF